MKLTRLRLIGFKSFVEPTDFLIEPGLTGVVGPNGCGKSNLVEALRWVMGEILVQIHARLLDGRGDLLRLQQPPGAQQCRSGDLDRQCRPLGAGRLQRPRRARHRAPHRARGRLHLPHQRPRGARPRRADPVRRRLHRRALAGAGAPGPHRRDHPGQARAAPPRAGGSRRHFRPACPPPRGRTAAEGGGNQSAARRGRDRPARRPDRRAEEAGAPGDPLPHRVGAGAQGGSDALSSALDRGERRGRRSRARQGPVRARGRRRAPARRRKPPRARRTAPAALPELREAEARAGAALAPAQRRAAGPRPRGAARQGPHRRTRSAAQAVRRRRRARAAARRRRRSRARAARRRGRRPSAPRRAKAPAAAAASMPAWPRPMASLPPPRRFSPT